MSIWSQASGFESCTKPVQVAFAKKFVEEEMDEKIKEQAEFEELTLDFKTYVELARALCQTSSQFLPGGLTSSCSSARASRPRASSST